MQQSHLWVRIINNVGLETNHPIGEIITVPMSQANELISKGLVEIHVNNIGRNSPLDITEDDFEWDDFEESIQK